MDKKLDELLSLMNQTKRTVFHQTQVSLEDQTATMLQYEALMYLKERPGGNMSELADTLRISHSSATQLIDRLVKGEYIKRVPDEADRRIIHLQITEKGVQQTAVIRAMILGHMKKIFSGLSDEDMDHLIRIHRLIIRNHSKIDQSGN